MWQHKVVEVCQANFLLKTNLQDVRHPVYVSQSCFLLDHCYKFWKIVINNMTVVSYCTCVMKPHVAYWPCAIFFFFFHPSICLLVFCRWVYLCRFLWDCVSENPTPFSLEAGWLERVLERGATPKRRKGKNFIMRSTDVGCSGHFSLCFYFSVVTSVNTFPLSLWAYLLILGHIE